MKCGTGRKEHDSTWFERQGITVKEIFTTSVKETVDIIEEGFTAMRDLISSIFNSSSNTDTCQSQFGRICDSSGSMACILLNRQKVLLIFNLRFGVYNLAMSLFVVQMIGRFHLVTYHLGLGQGMQWLYSGGS